MERRVRFRLTAPFDVSRVEVLRGPQGTLYGAGSMGGTVKLVVIEPEIGRFGGQAEGSVSLNRNGGIGGNVGIAINVPLGQTAAMRVVGYRYEDAGYIDNKFAGSPDPTLPVAGLGGASWADFNVPSFGVPPRNVDNVNTRRTDGVRGYLNWAPGDRFKLVLGAIYQRGVAKGLTENLPSLGTYVQSRMFPERLQDDVNVYSLKASYDLGGVDIVSVTSFVKRDQVQDRDVSAFFLTAPLQLADGNHNKTFSQEVRLSSSNDGPLRWLLGGYYSNTTARSVSTFKWRGTPQSLVGFSTLLAGLGSLAAPVTINDTLFRRNDRNTGSQIAGFGEVTYAITDTLSASAGLRVARYDLKTNGFTEGAFNGGTTTSTSRAKQTVNTPKVQLEFKPDRDQLYYVKAAKGFRLGAPNSPISSTCGPDLAAIGLTQAPSAMGSDSLWSYEAGAKRTLAGGRATINAAVFYIDWKNIQTSFLLPNCGFSFGGNAGNATSKGLELESSIRVGKALTLDGGLSYTDAQLSNDSPASTGIGGRKGDRLPGIPRWSVRGGIQADYKLLRNNAFARIDVRYLSDYLNRFRGDPGGATPAGDFVVIDGRMGVAVSERLHAEVFGLNLLNTKQLISVDTELPDQRQVLGRPRTIGMTLRYKY